MGPHGKYWKSTLHWSVACIKSRTHREVAITVLESYKKQKQKQSKKQKQKPHKAKQRKAKQSKVFEVTF
jgi:hypothetical protein